MSEVSEVSDTDRQRAGLTAAADTTYGRGLAVVSDTRQRQGFEVSDTRRSSLARLPLLFTHY
jgi:hypothetical protein